MTDAKKIGLFAATALVAGNMMGSGIALLPASLAKIGSISIYGWILCTIGAMSLAYVFARLGTINPQSGGPVAYAGEVAPILGYQSGVLYYHSNWIGNLAIAVTGVSYLAVFFPALHDTIPAAVATIAAVWVLTLVNLIGADWVGKLVSVGVILLLIPVVLTGTIGWFNFDASQFVNNWNTTNGDSNFHAFISSVVLCIWAFIGLESASVGAGLVKDPKRTIPLSTIIGTGTAALVYILSTSAMMGMFQAETLANSGAPFALSMSVIFGGSWIEPVVSAVTAFACFASLGSWMMLTAEAGARSAKEGYFPKIYGERTASGTPRKGIIIEAIQMTILMLILVLLQSEGDSADLFGSIASIAVLTVLLPYLYSCLNFIAINGFHRGVILQLTAGLIGALFCMVALYGAKGEGLAEATIISLIILIFYCRWDNEQKQNKLNIPKPAPTSVPGIDPNEVSK